VQPATNLHLFIDFDGTISLNDVGDERIDPSGAGVASRGRMGGVTARASCKRDVIRRVCG
jgi:hypothetical protein